MPKAHPKTNIIDLLLPFLALGLITMGIGGYGLYEPHETHFAMVGSEMLLRNDWVTPHLNGSPYLNKPPLMYWLIATSINLFGNTEFAARLPIALSAWGGIIVAGKWSFDLWGVIAYRVTTLMLSVTLGWYIFSHQILLDVLLGTLLLASNYFLWKLICKPPARAYFWLYFLGLYLSIALCLLTKGLIGLFFISFSYIAITIYHRSFRVFSQSRLLLGFLLVSAIILPWGLAIEHSNPGFWHYFLTNEHLNRLVGQRFPSDYEVSKTSLGGYLGITALWCFPWVIFVPGVILFIWQRLELIKTFQFFRAKKSLPISPEQNGILLLAIAFILPIATFLPLPSRLIYYGIPAIPAYITLSGGLLSQQFLHHQQQASRPYQSLKNKYNSEKHNPFFDFYGYIFLLLGAVFAIAIAIFPNLATIFSVIAEYQVFRSIFITVLLSLAVGFLLAGMGILKRDYQIAFNSLVICFCLVFAIFNLGFSVFQNERSSKKLVEVLDQHLPISTLWIFEGSREIGSAGGLSYYLNRNKQYAQDLKISASSTSSQPVSNQAGSDQMETSQTKASQLLLPLGFVQENNQQVYRNVLVLEDGGKNRIPPRFPGSKPSYLINKRNLQTYWDSQRPTLFITDLLRSEQDPEDPIRPNLPNNVEEPIFTIGTRQVYLNRAAVQSIKIDQAKIDREK